MIEFHFLHWEIQVFFYFRYSKQCKVFILGQCIKYFLGHACSKYFNHILSISVYHMKETGWEFISQTDTAELHYKFQEEKKK